MLHTSEDASDDQTGPWTIDVLEIDPADARVEAALATGVVPGTETVSSIVRRLGALAGINGGFFVQTEAEGTPGDLAGLSVLDGRLVSESVAMQTCVVTGTQPRIATLSSRMHLRAADGAKRWLDGANRAPGFVRGCGGSGGDRPTVRPRRDSICRDDDEIVLFTPDFGDSTPPGDGVEVVVGSSDRVDEVRRTRGGPIPAGARVLAGIGDGAGWLATRAIAGGTVDVQVCVVGADGAAADLAASDVIAGGPQLLSRGRMDVPATSEGFAYDENPEFFYRFGVRRNPRTLVGLAADGRVLLVTIDGRQPAVSVGASFRESAAVLRALGAIEGVNLDGGGSTTTAVAALPVNHPSDATGERAVGDAIVVNAEMRP